MHMCIFYSLFELEFKSSHPLPLPQSPKVCSIHLCHFCCLTYRIPACASSSLAFHMKCSAYKLNKQQRYTALTDSFPNLEPVCCSMSTFNCCFLICIQFFSGGGSGGLVFPSLGEFSTDFVIHTVKVFGIVNKAAVDFFFWNSCFFCDPVDVGNLISGSSAFSKISLNIWKFTVHC